MSYYTLLGAIAVPETARDPLSYADPDAPQFRGSSRSGAFHSSCSRMLDQFPGHESLRCLSDEPQNTQIQGDGLTALTLLDRQAAGQTLAELESLLLLLARSPAVLVNEVSSDDGGLTESHVAAAMKGAVVCRDLNQEAADGEDGDSPEFFFSALISLRALLHRALAESRNVVIYSWLPTRGAA